MIFGRHINRYYLKHAPALLLGILETILLAALGSGYSTIAVFAVMLVFLLIRPQGIAGSNVQEKA